MAGPIVPTQRMIDEHNVSHLPYRAWCAACVRGRGRSKPHKRIEHKEEEQVPVVSVDYGFLGSGGKGQNEGVKDSENPVLIVFDRRSKTIWAHPVPSKGIAHPWPAKVLTDDLDKLGYKKVVLKSDMEPSIRALAQAVKASWTGELILEGSPVGQSQSNGEVERAVQSVHGLARTLKEALEIQGNFVLDARSPALAWLIEYTGVLLNLFSRGSVGDGFTAFHRLKGRPWRIELPCFGETVEYKRRTGHKLDKRWETGVFLGINEATTEKIIGAKDGVVLVQSIQRVPEDRRFNKELLENLKGLPWDRMPTAAEIVGLPFPITMVPVNPEVPPEPTVAFDRPTQHRRHYITKADLTAFGYSDGCPACEDTRAGVKRKSGVEHSEACRNRILERLSLIHI